MGIKSLLQGKQAEHRAKHYLRKQGLSIVAQNQRYKCGEIDIIAKDTHSHIFVEVKYRCDNSRGESAEMVSRDKQIKLTKAAKLWLQENDPNFAMGCRFDVIAIASNKTPGNSEDIQWLKNAFAPELW